MYTPTFIGGLPRPRSLARAINRYRSGKLSQDGLEREYSRALVRAASRLVRAGIGLGTDGLFRWDDLFTPICRGLEGVREGGLYRFFDNNFYYRVPVVTDELRGYPCVLVDWYRAGVEAVREAGLSYEIRPALPGPLTFTLLCEDRHYSSREALLRGAAGVIERTVDELAKAGAGLVEVHEPAIGSKLADERLVRLCVELLESARGRCEIWVLTYFRYAKPECVKALLESDIDVVGVDVVENPRAAEFLTRSEGVVLGIVDARNTRMEKASELAVKLERLDVERGYLSPSAMLDFLPERIAYRKLRLLSRVSRRVGGKA